MPVHFATVFSLASNKVAEVKTHPSNTTLNVFAVKFSTDKKDDPSYE